MQREGKSFIMKILTKEARKDAIDFALKKDILIPCWLYKVPIKTKKNAQLNFIEQTILKLINIDDSLRDNIDKLSEMLGFFKKDENGEITKDSDKREIIKLMLKKISQLNPEYIEKEDDEKNIEVNIYQFYQEAYTNEILPLITKDINEFTFSENNQMYHENFYRKISFKENISNSREIKAILVDKFYKNKFTTPTQADLIKAIHLHNKNRYQGSHTIDYKDANIDITEPELIYLHLKLYIPRSDIDSIIITNGFTNDYSTLLRKIFTSHHQELLQVFRGELKSDTDKVKDSNIDIPFESNIRKYPEIVTKIKNIEKNINILQDKLSSSKEIKNAKLIAEKYYDTIEELLRILSEDLEDNNRIKNKDLLKSLAKDIGFKLDSQADLKVFGISSANNLQKYLAKSIIYKKNELYEIANKFPNLLNILDKLFIYRNGLKHSGREEVLEKIDDRELLKYKEMVYNITSTILKVNQKSINKNEFDSDDSNRYNAYIAIESELGIDTMSKLPQEIKDNFELISFYLYENDFDANRHQVVENIINLLYSSLEFIIKKLINTLYLVDIKEIKIKEEMLEAIKSRLTLSDALLTVREKMIEQAFKNRGGSLGAYMLIYLYFNDNTEQEEVELIENILKIRGHGNLTMEDVLKITQEQLETLKSNSVKYIKKLIEEI
jgi:hypothetical protein